MFIRLSRGRAVFFGSSAAKTLRILLSLTRGGQNGSALASNVLRIRGGIGSLGLLSGIRRGRTCRTLGGLTGYVCVPV